jgi:hypothetical protein
MIGDGGGFALGSGMVPYDDAVEALVRLRLMVLSGRGQCAVEECLAVGFMLGMDELFEVLGRSAFRRRFRLQGREAAYLREKGLEVVLDHARDFIRRRLAPAEPANDGRQTPMRNHPVFIAQHATATCCRGCLEKWHNIPKGRPLSDREVEYVVSVLRRWLVRSQGQ